MVSKAKMLAMSREVDSLTAKYPIGTPCRYRKDGSDGFGLETKTRSAFAVLGGHTIVVWVEGQAGCVAASRVSFDRFDATFALVKEAIGLAIVRHGLECEEGDVESHIEEIATDAWNAMRGVDTCNDEPTAAWKAFWN